MGWPAGRHVDHPCGGQISPEGLLEKSLTYAISATRTNFAISFIFLSVAASRLRQSSDQHSDWKSSWTDFSEVSGGFGRKFPEGGLDFLEVALVWKFPHGILPKQTSKKFDSEPPKLLS